jgi:hypothetical protein
MICYPHWFHLIDKRKLDISKVTTFGKILLWTIKNKLETYFFDKQIRTFYIAY